MKKPTIQRVALTMALTMTMGTVVTGCGSKTEPTVSTTSATQQESVQPESTTEEAAANFGKISVMTYDRGTINSSEGSMTDNRWTRWINENAPFEEVTFIAVPKAEAPQTMSNLFSAGTGPDVVANYEDTLPFVNNGMALEITDEMIDKMPNYKRVLEEYPVIDKLCKVNGKRYTIGKMSNVLPNHTIVIRTDWLDNLGLSMPETTDDLLEICRAFTEDDPDGNGQNDTWGISMTTDTQRILAHMWGFPSPEKYAIIDGELTYQWDKIESWLDYTKKIIDGGYVNPDFMTMKGDDDRADFLNGKIGIYGSGRFSQVNSPLYKDFKTANPDASLDTFALPATEYGAYTAYCNGGPSIVGFINADTDNVDGALAYINWLYDPEVTEYLMYGEEGVYFTKDSEGTHVVVDAAKNEIEFNYASDYSIMKNELFTGSEVAIDVHADDFYNQYLKSSDPIMQEFGDLFYKMTLIANDDQAGDPRKWQQALPVLPTELNIIKSTADPQTNEKLDTLKAALADKNKTAHDAVEEIKQSWYDAGGQKVEDFYREYYKTMGSEALLFEDYFNLKDQPVMTETAQKNSQLAKDGKLTLR